MLPGSSVVEMASERGAKFHSRGNNSAHACAEQRLRAINVAIDVPLAGGWQILKVLDIKVLMAFSRLGRSREKRK